ncbi:MAG TPA: DUF5700 domain-containing putative Zn-dependent protease [Chitinophagaceae bacterium]|jgi:hypothetical protein|nr:DUF5700 domain-containing putative Zn-dependent protease [Chitinophagaceae bacterium]
MIKRAAVCYCLLFFSFMAKSQDVQKEGFDLQSLGEFWKVYDMLVRDEEPGEKEWTKLFSSPCYSFLKKDSYYRRIFRLAFKPSLYDSSKIESARKNYNSKEIAHLRRLLLERSQVDSFVRTLDRKRIESALRKTDILLPPGFRKNYQLPPVLVSVFEPAAYSYDEQIAVDVLLAKDLNGSNLISHEAHHFFMGKLTRLKKPSKGNPDYYFLHALYQLQIEGIADLLDIGQYPSTIHDALTNDLFNTAYENSPEVFFAIDSIIQVTTADSLQRSITGKKLFESLVMAGHPNGFYMTILVTKKFGRGRLVSELDNPFNLLWRYQEIALAEPEKYFTFSERAIDFFKDLESKYILRKG